nr:RNA-directed DNA polymerase, eukaryota [Tanacetum cinerariifolium]
MNSSQEVHAEVNSDYVGPKAVKYGGSVLEVMEEMIRVGQVMGESLGYSGGILCVWEATVFKKDYVTISDNFVAIYGTWLPSISKILFVAIYAPRAVQCKWISWDYIMTLIVCLDRHLSDHRPILLHEAHTDFGPTPFRMVRFKKKLQDLKSIIRSWVKDKRVTNSGAKVSIRNELHVIDKELDNGVVSDASLLRRLELNRHLNEINAIEAKDFIQKSKVKWAIEGDENSKFFHGIINKKRSQLAIHGFRFKEPLSPRLRLNFPFSKRLSQVQAFDMEMCISRDEIRLAVWSCRANKSPDPDGFTFEFFKKYWNFVGSDFYEAVEYFFEYGSFPKGCNYSFVALIPKVTDAKLVNDFRPISLIGCVYKVVTKIFVNRLAVVILGLISDTQSAFVAGRQILDGPFILNEILHWCKRKNKQVMFFKVDFAKAHDSWIRGTFSSAKALVLDNGSPSNEFSFYCGLKQGVMVGECMSRHKAWEDTVVKLKNRLSKWKAKTLSIGRRLTLLKSVLVASPLYSMSILKVPRGILKVMESIRNNFFIGADPSVKKITWVAWDKSLKDKGFDFGSHCKKRTGNGQGTRFWVDNWISDMPLCLKFPRLFALELDEDALVAVKMVGSLDHSFRRTVRDGMEQQQMSDLILILESVSLSTSQDRWICDLSGDGEFWVKEVRIFLDDLFLPSFSEPTRWVKCVPIKINIFAWRACRDCLPTRSNLARRGVSLESSRCPLCDACEEDIHHVLFRCSLAQLILRRICRW